MRVNIQSINPFGCRADTSPLMPIQRQVSDLTDASDSDSFEAAPKGQRAASSGQKRKQLTPAERSSEGHLRSVLGRECGCKRKTCFQQFIFEPAFSELSNYRCHWYELHKLDQDQFAPRPHRVFTLTLVCLSSTGIAHCCLADL